MALKVPLTMSEIIDSSVETFTELVQTARLTSEQEQLVRDIRRRGKNKVKKHLKCKWEYETKILNSFQFLVIMCKISTTSDWSLLTTL